MKRSLFLVLLIFHIPVIFANDLDLANRALDRGDYATAAAAFRKLAEQGNIKAQSHLGYLYYAGEGVPQSFEEAVKWYRKAATQGDPDAQYNLAVAYAFGEGVAKDLREAATWYRRAAEQGHPVAQYSLGISHAYGEGVKQDGALAARWFLQAAEQDYEPAQVMIASIYHTGDGIPQDHAKAARWYRKAAEKGNAVAQYNLGTLYRAGKGVVKNNEVAKRWFTKAARQGYSAAEKELLAMQQAVTVAPGGTPALAPEPQPEAETGPDSRPAPGPETGATSVELSSGDLTSEQHKRQATTTQSDEALVTIRKEDLLTLEPEPETEPLATVDEISGVEYQGAPTARPARLDDKADETADVEESRPTEKQVPVKPDNVVTRPVETKVVEKPESTDGEEADTGKSGEGVLGFFRKIFTAENKTETARIESPVPTGPIESPYTPRPTPPTVIDEKQTQVAEKKNSTNMPIESAPVETPYKPRPAPVTVTQPAEQKIARVKTKKAEEELDWGRPRSRAPQESSATSYAQGEAPAGQQLEESREERRATGTTQTWEKEAIGEPATESEERRITAEPETSPVNTNVTAETDVPGNEEIDATGASGTEESGGLGNFFKRLFGGDDKKAAAGAEPGVAEQAVTEQATGKPEVSETLDEVTESEPIVVARAEPETVDIPVDKEAETVQEDTTRSPFDDTLSLAVEGNPGSQFELATMYYRGDGVERDLEQAFIWYRRAAQQGNADAQFNLANMYLLGEGTGQSDSRAKDWFKKAAAQGHSRAEQNLRNLETVVAAGDETPAEVIPIEKIQPNETVVDTDAVEPIKKTASVTKEDIEAEAEPVTPGEPGEDSYTRGMAYAYGEGAQQNHEMAFKYFQHSARQGYVPAQYRLGVAYANGEGTEQDYQAALQWYQKAARRGYAIAQRSLCKMYLEGLGVEQNKPLALAWYSILAENGNAMDTHRRDQLAQELTEAERQQAERLRQELTASITTASSDF